MENIKKDRFPWITMSICVALLVSIFMITQSGLSEQDQVSIMTGILTAMFIAMLVFVGYYVYRMFKNERRYKIFRETLKIGDTTREGIIMDIVGDEVTIAKTMKMGKVYPPESKEDIINWK